MKLNRQLFRIHGLFGLLTGIFLLLLGLSGSALVFMKEQDGWLNKKLLTVAPVGQRLPLDTLYRKITQRYPNLDGLAWLNPEATATEAYTFRLYENDGKLPTYDLGIISFNPYTAEILREGRYDQLQSGIMQWLLQFHFSFHLGMPGAALTAIFGITMLISILTGLLVYKKFIWKALTLRVKIKGKNWRTISSDLHRVVGVWALGFNAVIFFTGFWMNLFAFDRQIWQGEMTPAKPNIVIRQSFDAMLAQARQALPTLQASYVYFPTQPERHFSVSGKLPGGWAIFGENNSVSIDPQTARIKEIKTIRRASFGEKVEAVVFPLHVGSFGGVPIRVLYIVVGLTPGLLSITGFLLWWRRNRKPRGGRRKIPVNARSGAKAWN